MKYWIILMLINAMISCTPAKDVGGATKDTTPSCKTLATIKDNSGLDGCRFVIVLDDGKRLEPLAVEDKNFQFSDGQRIRLNYEQEREMMSVCMSGMGVRVTCIEKVE
jgi:hypothetical protein